MHGRPRSTRARILACSAVAAVALVPFGATGASIAASKVKAPKSGTYTGNPGAMTLYVSGKSVSLAAFSFKCGAAKGRTSVNAMKLKWTRKGYKFSLKGHGNVTYSDDQPDENAAVNISGRFSKTGKSSAGIFRVKSPRCGSTGDVKWRAFR